MNNEQSFKYEMNQCGYDVDNAKSDNEQQVINVAKCMWRSQQNRLDDAERRAATAEWLARKFRLAQERPAQQGRYDQPEASDA